MLRPLLGLIAAAFVFGALPFTTTPSVSAQPGGPPVCVSLSPGEHTFTAPARDRDGEVTFNVTIGEGGVVTAFTEPGGQSIPPSAMHQIFGGEDPYPLPDGVAFIDCPEDDGEMMEDDAMGEAESGSGYCISLDAGSHTEMISAGGRSYDVTINVGDNHQIIDVEILGNSYSAADALGLLEGFGASLPDHWVVSTCGADSTDRGSSSYPQSGTGGLADTGGSNAAWIALIALAATASVAVLFASTVVTRRRRATTVRNRD